MSGANLEGALLSYARITRANFTEASLRNTNLRFAKTTGTKFVEANFQGANLVYTGMYKDSVLQDFPGLKHNKKTRWDDKGLPPRGKHVKKVDTAPSNSSETNLNENNSLWRKLGSFFSNG